MSHKTFYLILLKIDILNNELKQTHNIKSIMANKIKKKLNNKTKVNICKKKWFKMNESKSILKRQEK